jgi:hypothetical protein
MKGGLNMGSRSAASARRVLLTVTRRIYLAPDEGATSPTHKVAIGGGSWIRFFVVVTVVFAALLLGIALMIYVHRAVRDMQVVGFARPAWEALPKGRLQAYGLCSWE